MKLNKMVFDDKKIEAAANKHIETEYARYNSGEVEEEMICLRGKDSDDDIIEALMKGADKYFYPYCCSNEHIEHTNSTAHKVK